MNDAVPTRPPASTPPRSMPVMSIKLELHTDHAQRVYRRAFDRLKGDLYVCTVRTVSNRMDTAAQAIETLITTEFSSVRKDLDSELERVEVMFDALKVSEMAQFERAEVFDAQYSTPRAKEYLDLLRKMDQLLMRYDTLWLLGEISTKQRVDRSHNWQRRLIKVANRLRELGNRTRNGLTREAQLRATGTPASSDTATAVPPEAATLDDDDDLDSSSEDETSEPAKSETSVTAQGSVGLPEREMAQVPAEEAAISESSPDTEARPARTRRRATAVAASG